MRLHRKITENEEKRELNIPLNTPAGSRMATMSDDGEAGLLSTVSIQTQGCKLNQADSEVLARRFTHAGYKVVPPGESADILVINTCTVTHVADAKARQAIRSAHRRDANAFVVATGCYAERSSAEVSTVEGVGLVVGNREKGQLVELVLAARGDQLVACAVGEEPPRTGTPDHSRTRAILKIQEGCNQVCAYCIVPRVRGRERSIPPDALLGQVRQRVAEGYKEVVLTGTQLGSYGFDIPEASLRSLVELLLKESGAERIRVSSLQPQEITPDLLELWSDPRLCPHFHIPLQSGCDDVLKRMRRRYTTARYAEAASMVRARVPGVTVTTDIIVGFPGEGEDEFRESIRFAEAMRFASMHVFPYSVRRGTSAAYMGPKVGEEAKRARMDEMLNLAGGQAAASRRGAIGTTRRVLWERSYLREGRSVYLGLTDNYLKVSTEEDMPLINRITPTRLVAEKGETLLGRASE